MSDEHRAAVWIAAGEQELGHARYLAFSRFIVQGARQRSARHVKDERIFLSLAGNGVTIATSCQICA